jgi:hypothetical protein
VKAAAVRRLAAEHASAALDEAVTALVERGEELFPIEGDDPGERLTHLLVAVRVRGRMDAGEDLQGAFRAEMAAVRDVLTNS